MTHELKVRLLALIFCAALVYVIATLCKIGERNRKIELDSIWGG
jgi:hypothetical protein